MPIMSSESACGSRTVAGARIIFNLHDRNFLFQADQAEPRFFTSCGFRVKTVAGGRLVVATPPAVVVDELRHSRAGRDVVHASDTLQEVLAAAAPLVVTLLGPRARLDAKRTRRLALSHDWRRR